MYETELAKYDSHQATGIKSDLYFLFAFVSVLFFFKDYFSVSSECFDSWSSRRQNYLCEKVWSFSKANFRNLTESR